LSVNSLARRTTKAAVLPLGLPRRRRAGDLVVLLYHRVGAGGREIDVDRPTFERQMAYLATTGLSRRPDEVLDGRRGGVVVSVDDGYADFHREVLPVVARHRIPVILYLATGLVDGHAAAPRSDAISWSQLREAVSTGLVTVGSHTHTHADLSHAGEVEAGDEMRRSKELIEDRLGTACRHFAYPWSVASPDAERAAAAVFDTAALRWCTNRRGKIEPMRLGRTPVLRSDGLLFFRAKVEGVLDHEASVYRILRRGPWR